MKRHSSFYIARVVVLISVASAFQATATDVLMHHNDIARTGAVLDETILSPSTLKTNSFGRLISLPVEGQIYAQPLVVSDLELPGKGRHSVVYVATMRNHVYAYDAEGTNATPFWHINLGSPMVYDRIPKDAGAQLGQYNIHQYIGITSTPVIDRATGRMYVVAKIADPPCPGVREATDKCPVEYWIHALDIASGAVLGKEKIEIPMHEEKVPTEDVARRHLQRPALLLANGRVYAAFGAHQDARPFQGWIMAFDAATLKLAVPVFCTTPGGQMGGIWQAGNGPAADAQGNIYVMTGNGTFDPTKNQFGCVALKLDKDLNPLSWFAPANVEDLNEVDADLGSSGPMLMPGKAQVVGGGKEGKLYVLNCTNLGGLQKHHWWCKGTDPPVQYFQAARPWRVTWLSWIPFLFNVGYHHMHGSPVYWQGTNGTMIYVWPEEDNLKAFRYEPAKKKFKTKPLKGMMGNEGMPGGFLSVSANGNRDGIVWAAIPYEEDAWVHDVRGSLRAFRADNLKLLWSTDTDDPYDHFDFSKGVPPTVANGKVYLATFSDRLNIYGTNSPFAMPHAAHPHKVSKESNHRGHVKGANGHRLSEKEHTN